MIKVKAPINIALIKYWGKQDTQDVKPSTPSISLTLKAFSTTTSIEITDEPLFFSLDDSKVSNLTKIKTFIHQFTDQSSLKIISHNSGPTAAGLASSASGFSALGFALNTLYPKDEKTFVQYVANGSGSATRSLLGGAVKWDLDGTISSVPFKFEDYLMGLILINTQPKKITSRVAMKDSKETPLFKGFVKRNTKRAKMMEGALINNDFHLIGRLMEASTLDMHALPLFHKLPFSFLTNESLSVIQKIIHLRKQGLYGYFTADAGPNIKVLFKKSDLKNFESVFKTLNHPFVISEIDDQGARLL